GSRLARNDLTPSCHAIAMSSRFGSPLVRKTSYWRAATMAACELPEAISGSEKRKGPPGVMAQTDHDEGNTGKAAPKQPPAFADLPTQALRRGKAPVDADAAEPPTGAGCDIGHCRFGFLQRKWGRKHPGARPKISVPMQGRGK